MSHVCKGMTSVDLRLFLSVYKNQIKDFSGDPVAETVLPTQGAQVQSMVRELDPTFCS